MQTKPYEFFVRRRQTATTRNTLTQSLIRRHFQFFRQSEPQSDVLTGTLFFLAISLMPKILYIFYFHQTKNQILKQTKRMLRSQQIYSGKNVTDCRMTKPKRPILFDWGTKQITIQNNVAFQTLSNAIHSVDRSFVRLARSLFRSFRTLNFVFSLFKCKNKNH